LVRARGISGPGCPRSLKTGLLALICLLSAAGCSGYRTYNSLHFAQQSYKEGQKARTNPTGKANLAQTVNPDAAQAKGQAAPGAQFFEEAAKKCLYFLSQNSTGRRIDDALMLMGMSFYELGRYVQAENSLQKLLDTQRKSKFRDDAQYYLVLILLQRNEIPLAELAIERLIDEYPKSEYRPLAQFYLGEKLFQLRNYPRSVEVFSGVLKNYPKFKRKGETISYLAKVYFEMGQYDQSLAIYEQLRKDGRDAGQRREGLIGMASCKSRLGLHEEALALYQVALQQALYKEERAEAYVGIYVEYTFLNRASEALDGFETVIADYPRTRYSADAWYELGLIFKNYKDIAGLDTISVDSVSLKVFGMNSKLLEPFKGLSQGLISLKLAQSAFQSVQREDSYSPLVLPATDQVSEVQMLYQIFEQMEASDSTTSRDALARLQFLLAEFHEVSGKPEMARSEYERLIFEYPGTIWTPKAAMNLAQVSAQLQDSSRYRETLELIVENFPETRYADEARKKLGLPVPDRPPGFYLDELAAYTPPRITKAVSAEGPGGKGKKAPGHETHLQMRRRLFLERAGKGGGA
jgi:TolA-binding protein